MAKLINFLSSILPFWVLRIFLPERFGIYGHLISDRPHLVSNYYKYPSIQELDDFITWIESMGYNFVTFDQYIKDDGNKKVLLTFDDGFKIIYDELHSHLTRRKIPYVLFVLTDPLSNPDFYIKTVRPDPTDSKQERIFLSAEEIKVLKKQGVHIGFHTRSHRLVKDSDPLDEELKLELTIPKEYENLFSEPLCFAYPYMAPKKHSVYNHYMSDQLGYKYFFDTRGFNVKENNHFFRVSIDAEKGTDKKFWIHSVFKRQLLIFLIRLLIFPFRKQST
jgi:peptidoglycan/xylan/chitin deacetylase (PgdA/CDA1 family)